jgi:hypothetical protein
VEEYDPLTDTWTQKADMPTSRFGAAAVTVNGKINVLGGASGYDALATIEEYDPALDSWMFKASMPNPRVASAVMVDEQIYIIGGAVTIKPPHPGISTVEVWTF